VTPIAAGLVLALAAAQAAAPEDIRIVLSRTECLGVCPVYTVSVAGDGAVRYDGLKHVRVTGTEKWAIDPAAVRSLADQMEQAGFFGLKDEYAGVASDLPTTIVTLTRGTRTKTVKDYLGAPGALKEIEARIDTVTRARDYVRPGATLVRQMRLQGWRATDSEAAAWMYRALVSGDVETITALLDAGADPRAADGNGVTLVMHAAESGAAEAVRVLLAAGGDPTARDKQGRNAADRARDGLSRRVPDLFPFLEATGKPRDYALVLKLLTDE